MREYMLIWRTKEYPRLLLVRNRRQRYLKHWSVCYQHQAREISFFLQV